MNILDSILDNHKNWLKGSSTHRLDWGILSAAEKESLREANLRGANLQEANLQEANLRGANLQEANLQEANLRGADLRGADLWGAYLWGANLWGANLWEANLQEANLRGANLRGANLWGANLWGANLWGANLRGADLWEANLWEANLWGVAGNMREVKSLFLDSWPISYTADVLQIGCERHAVDEWRCFGDDRISTMHPNALEWWKKWKIVLFQMIEMSPAIPTGEEKQDENN